MSVESQAISVIPYSQLRIQ